MTTPTLTTERLILRELRPSDTTEVLTFRGDPEVLKFDGPLIHTTAEALAFIEEVRQEGENKQSVAWGIALPETDRLIGSVGLWYWEHYHRRAEIGYGLATKYWGQGLAQEAVRAAALYGFEQMHLNRIYARTIVANERSVRMLERLGFIREGTQRKYSLEDDGEFYDSAMYGLLREDWGVA